jgi:competence protein ComEC
VFLWPAAFLLAAALAIGMAHRTPPARPPAAAPSSLRLTVSRYPLLRDLAVAALVVTLGALLVSADLHGTAGDDPSRFLSPDTVTVHGTVFEVAGRSPRSARYLVDCDSLTAGSKSRGISGRILLILTGRAAEPAAAGRLHPGRTLSIRAPLRGIEPARNPGEVDWRAHYLLGGVRARMGARDPGQVVPGPEDRDGFVSRFVIPARRELSARLRSVVSDREARFLNGLILGERSDVPPDLRAEFITVGVMHLLAISGQQVVLVAMLLAALLRALRIPAVPRFVLLACALGYYVLLTGGSPSVTRAGIMAVVMLGGAVAQRRADIHNALGVSAAAVLLADPARLFDPGFLLSYAAVLSIVLLYPLILSATPGLNAGLARVRILDLAWKGAAVSLAAGLGTLPITAYFFGRISVVGFAANILIVPLSSAALVLGMLALAASFLGPWIAAVYAAGAEASAWLTFRLVGLFAGVPYASVGFRISLFSLAAAYGLLALGLRSAARRSWRPLAAGILLACNLALYRDLFRAEGSAMRVTFLDVGQGDAAFVEFPGGATMLIDGGPGTASSDAGTRTVVPFLGHMGVRRIDYMVLSHPHGDHLAGLPAVLRAFPVGSIIEGPSPGTGGLYARFARTADSLGIPRMRRRSGELVGEGLPARICVVSPEQDAGGDAPENLNDASVSILVRYGTTSVLFPGDAEAPSEGAMAARFGSFLDADILKAGHHGSRTSSTGTFLRCVSPAWTVISAGEGNRFGHPSPEVLERLSRLGTSIHRTDLEGAGVFESDGRAWRRLDRADWP